MHSLRRARVLAVTFAGAASSPHKRGRVYSAGASKTQAPALEPRATTAATGGTTATSKPLEAAEEEAKSSSLSLTQTNYRIITRLAAEASGEAEAVSWPRPSEIPFQAKVANSVTLIGYIHVPVQFEAAPDGKSWARTVITQDQSSGSPSLWIPITFEGDLAHIAISHLKEKDHVFIEGQLNARNPAFGEKPGQTNVQVMVRSINFVDVSSRMTLNFASHNYDRPATTKQDVKKKLEDSWRDLLHNPEDWLDFRKAKLDGSVSKKFPDFKRKDETAVLWLNSAPRWVLSSIEGIKFGGDEAWRDLVENPDNWWDNRSDKTSTRYPDFKHKETGRGLWLDNSPSWVLSKLPPLKPPEESSPLKPPEESSW